MKLLFDFLPLILFLVSYFFGGIYIATGVTIAATVIIIGFMLLKGKKPDVMQWVSLGIITVFGGATIILQNPMFIKWKPTVLYAFMGVALLASQFVFKKNALKLLMGKELDLPDSVWLKLTFAWAFYFFFMAVLNIIIAYSWTEENWVKFKVFGGIILTIIFAVLQSFYLVRYMKEDKQPSSIPQEQQISND